MKDMNANEFIAALNAALSPLILNNRTTLARFSSSKNYTNCPFQSSIFVSYYNLPEPRHRQQRGGGAESENNRMLFIVHGFHEDESKSVDKVQVEQSVCSVGDPFVRTPSLRKKTASPDKIAVYLAKYINNIADTIPPNLSHE